MKHFNFEKLDRKKRILIYGASIGGEIIYQILKKNNIEVWNICDRARYGEKICGVEVIEPETVFNEENVQVLITATRSFQSIVEMLENNTNMDIYDVVDILNVDDICYDDIQYERDEICDFVIKYQYYANLHHQSNSIILPTFDIAISEICNLKCKHCSTLVPYLNNKREYESNRIIEDLEKLLKSVDKIIELVIVGGEPFLYRELSQLIRCLISYEKVETITIVTNGTIIPDEHIIMTLSCSKVRVRLSEYHLSCQKHDKLIEIFEKNNIRYYVQKLSFWLDMGLPKAHHYSENELTRLFKDCAFNRSQALLNGKIFRCIHAAEIHHMLNVELEEGLDYIEVRNKKEINKQKLYKYLFGIDSIRLCDYCNGALKNAKGIQPGIQLQK